MTSASRNPDGGRGEKGVSVYDRLMVVLRDMPGINQWGPDNDKGTISITIKIQEGAFFIIARRLAPSDGGPEVAFQEVASFVELFRMLSKDVDTLRWKPDKYALEKRGST